MTRRISLAVVTDWSQKGLRAPKTVRNRQTSENAKPLKTRGSRESRDRRERPYWSHNPKVVGSNPTPATNESACEEAARWAASSHFGHGFIGRDGRFLGCGVGRSDVNPRVIQDVILTGARN